MTPLSFFKSIRRQRTAVSPVIATTIILAITVVLGLTLWSFANSGVGTATVQYSQAVTEYGDVIRNHRYVIANVDFNNPGSNEVAFWVYNNGKIDATIGADHIILTCKVLSPSDCTGFNPNISGLTQDSPDDPLNPFTLASNTLKKFHFASGTTLQSGTTYELTVVSDEGLTQTFVKRID